MKVYSFIALLVCCTSLFGNADTFPEMEKLEIREMFYQSTSSSSNAKVFLEQMLNSSDDSLGINKGYLAMAYMIQAKFTWNPYNKLSLFFKGRDILEEQIEIHQKSTELIFLRFCVQSKSPAFLGYSSNIEKDKNYLLAQRSSLLDKDLQYRIKKCLNEFEVIENKC